MLDALAHDLCSPTAAIKVTASRLRDDDIEWTPDQAQQSLAIIEEEVDRLNATIRQLLDLSRIRAGRIVRHIQPTFLSDVVEQAVASRSSQLRPVEVQIHDGLTVLVDQALLTRAVVNLVANALKHGGAKCAVRVVVVGREDRVELSIVDRGPGIPHVDRRRIFERFTQLGTGDGSGSTGVGLGLAIADGFVRAMDGTIEVDDTPGGGTTMTIVLPSGAGSTKFEPT